VFNQTPIPFPITNFLGIIRMALYALFYWMNEDRWSVILEAYIKEPRLEWHEYQVGHVVKATYPSFKGLHTAMLLDIKGTT
jgi:hypothetical protein